MCWKVPLWWGKYIVLFLPQGKEGLQHGLPVDQASAFCSSPEPPSPSGRPRTAPRSAWKLAGGGCGGGGGGGGDVLPCHAQHQHLPSQLLHLPHRQPLPPAPQTPGTRHRHHGETPAFRATPHLHLHTASQKQNPGAGRQEEQATHLSSREREARHIRSKNCWQIITSYHSHTLPTTPHLHYNKALCKFPGEETSQYYHYTSSEDTYLHRQT